MAGTLVLRGRARCLLGTAPIGELAEKKMLQRACELEHQQQVETRHRWLPAVCRFKTVGRPIASEQPRPTSSGTRGRTDHLVQNLLVGWNCERMKIVRHN